MSMNENQRVPLEPLAPTVIGYEPVYHVNPGYNQGMRNWHTGVFDCLKDEETCWWSYWCPLLVTLRTWGQFSIGNMKSTHQAVGAIILALIFTFFFQAFFFVLIVLGLCCFVPYFFAQRRGQIRQKLRISGTQCEDCTAHCFCSVCAVAQESREAYAAGMPSLDMCSGDPLQHSVSSVESSNPLIDGRDGDADAAESYNAELGIPAAATASADMLYLSKTSWIILSIMGAICATSAIVLFATKRSKQVLVLSLVLLQPVVVLYYFYWKPLRNNVALDYVVKLFAIGFFLTTIQASLIEELIQLIFLLIALPWLVGALNLKGDTQFTSETGQIGQGTKALGLNTLTDSGVIGKAIRRLSANVGPFSNTNVESYMHTSGTDSPSALPIPDIDLRAILRQHWGLALVGCFLISFVIAAGVEETMKNFIVRCYRFGSPLRDPYTVTVFFLAGALGFATAENISYVFGNSGVKDESPIEGLDEFQGELLILLLRVLMPVHLLCAVLQAANVSEIVSGKTPDLGLFRVLLPAILLHGFYDFALFLLAVFSYAEELDTSTGFQMFTLCISFLTFLGGLKYAHVRFKQVSSDYDQGFHQLNDSTEHSEHIEMASL